MNKIILFNFLIFLIVGNVIASSREVPDGCWRAATYEHNSLKDPKRPLYQLNANLEIYERVAKKASKYNINFLVYPEYALIFELEKNDTLGSGVATFVSELNTNLCKLKKPENDLERINDHVLVNRILLRRLSCIANENNFYIAVNLVEIEKNLNIKNSTFNNLNDDYLLFNTVVVFNNKGGELIAKYRKFHLFDEPPMCQPNEPEIVTFTAHDYGKFGLAICADSLFENPIRKLVEDEKINHLIFPTAWFDTFPSLTSLSFHSSMATKYKINVLSACNRHYEIGGFGSGIYTPDEVKIQTSFDNKLLVIADLPIAGSNKSIDSDKCNYRRKVEIGKKEYKEHSYLLKEYRQRDYHPVIDPKNLLKLKRLDSKEDNITMCAADVCCDLEFKKVNSNHKLDNFYLMITSKPNHTWESYIYQYLEGCIVATFDENRNEYKQNSVMHFEKLILKGKFNTTVIYPSVLSSRLRVLSRNRWSFIQNETEAVISINNLNKPINFVSLFVRNYNKYLGDPNRNY